MLTRLPFPKLSNALIEKARILLDRALGPSKLITGADACAAYSSDESDQEPAVPDIVVLASSPADIATALTIANDVGVPITPRGAGSGKSGGAVPVAGGIVLATSGLSNIIEIDREGLIAVVEPGVILADLHYAVEAENLFYPPDPNSVKMCALGGNIAENASGPRCFKYGPTRDYVLGLDVITMSGQTLAVGKRTVKGVTGYDVTSLLVGSEGTLAVTTRAVVKLIPKPESVATLLALFKNVGDAGNAVSAMVAARLRPRCIELLDSATLNAVRAKGVAVDEQADAMLLLEVDGAEVACENEMERIGNACTSAGALDVLAAQDAAQRERLWEARRMLSAATRAMARYKISEDVVVPRPQLPALLQSIEKISEKTGVRMLSYGHAGDGNLHVNLLWNEKEQTPHVEEALKQLFMSVISMRGTLSGEHGIGASKAAYLPLEQSADLIALQRQLKAVFDPKGLLNPGKIFPRIGHGSC
ncbi:MAG: FAD-binding protein [Polyangiaceae bacterium]|nr:FAD-binding protein [Polyangiaceae bacterium]